MIRILISIFYCAGIVGPGFSQVHQPLGKLNLNWSPGGIVSIKNLPALETAGSEYLNDEWLEGSIFLFSGDAIENLPLKYDLENERMEIKTKVDIKILNREMIRMFKWKKLIESDDRLFINCSEYDFEGTKLIGFFEVLVDGDLALFLKTDLLTVKAYYNQALDAGHREDRIIKEEKKFIGSGSMVYDWKNKKEFYSLFNEKSAAIKTYVKNNKLDIKDHSDLIKVINYLNNQ